jgi:DNA-directed RNA polymerase subunit M/transcription elongation factor TFIIS
MGKLKQRIKCEECGNKTFYLVEELQENKKTKLAELNVFYICTKCMKTNGSYTVQLGVPIKIFHKMSEE